MRSILLIGKREILSYFVSPAAYFVIAGFVLLSEFFFFSYLINFNQTFLEYANSPYSGVEKMSLNEWVIEAYYHTLILVLVFLVPLLTMRITSEERKSGTFELLLTSPVSVSQIVYGKYLGLSCVVVVMCLFSFVCPLLLCIFVNPEIAPVVSGAVGVLLCGLAFTSIGMAASSFSDSQIVSGVSSMVVLLLLYIIFGPQKTPGGTVEEVLRYMSPVWQVNELIEGVVSIQGAVYFVSLIAVGLFLCQRALDAERWR